MYNQCVDCFFGLVNCNESEKTTNTDSNKTPSFHTLVEIEVASQMQAVIVNRYDQQSIHITESFMIKHNLNISNISVW